jgi:hypothetical protein
MSMDEKCRNCEYYVESDETNAGRCRRYPPVVYGDVSNAGGIGETYPSTAWPEVRAMISVVSSKPASSPRRKQATRTHRPQEQRTTAGDGCEPYLAPFNRLLFQTNVGSTGRSVIWNRIRIGSRAGARRFQGVSFRSWSSRWVPPLAFLAPFLCCRLLEQEG